MIKKFNEFKINESMDEENAVEVATSILQTYDTSEVSESEFTALQDYIRQEASNGNIMDAEDVNDRIRGTISNRAMFNRIKKDYETKDV